MLPVDRPTRLADVTFCVLDLETTGTSDEADEIVEVGAVLVRGGQRLGTFQTLVCHSLAVGPSDRPRIEPVLASLLEFVRGAVIVGHNVRFDLRFLNAALWKAGHDVTLDPADAIDTMPLARRLLRDDADDCRLGTLAQRFEFDQRPTHRAFADAASTVELLHLVIERATHYGATDLDDLARLAGLMRHRHRSKLAVTAHLPRAAGVACLLDRNDQVLHVVNADDLRHGVRRLFDADDPQQQPAGRRMLCCSTCTASGRSTPTTQWSPNWRRCDGRRRCHRPEARAWPTCRSRPHDLVDCASSATGWPPAWWQGRTLGCSLDRRLPICQRCPSTGRTRSSLRSPTEARPVPMA